MAIDHWLVEKLSRLLYARYGRRLRSELRRWNDLAEEGRLLHHWEQLASKGQNVVLRPGVHILAPQRVHLGNHVAIGYNSILRGQGGIRLDDFALLGDNVVLATVGHPLGEVYFDNTEPGQPIHIKENCWLAAGVIVLPGVTIGENSVIGAGAVVSDDIPPNSLAVGIPARVVRSIDPNDDLLAQQKQSVRERFREMIVLPTP